MTPVISKAILKIFPRKSKQKKHSFSPRKNIQRLSTTVHMGGLSSLISGRYVEVNETFLLKMGYQHCDVIGKTSLEINSWDTPSDRLEIIDKINKDGKITNYEISQKTCNSKVLLTKYWGEAIEIAGERCLLSVSLDVTEQKSAEQEQLRLEKMRSEDLAGFIRKPYNSAQFSQIVHNALQP